MYFVFDNTKYFFIGLLSLARDDLRRNAIQIPTALRSESAAAVGVLFDQFHLLQSLEDLAGDGAGTAVPMGRSASVVFAD